MPIEILTIPCRTDNYAFVFHDTKSGQTGLVDAPQAQPILAALDEKSWQLSHIFITHHHFDHVDGCAEIVQATGAKTYGNAQDANRLPALDHPVRPGERIDFASHKIDIWDVSGHTIGHVAYIFPDANAAFTADSLMTLGCGRVFEGSFAMMYKSLLQFNDLPDDTMLYTGHEYTQTNAQFALTIEPDNPDLIQRSKEISAKRASGVATVPSSLGLERATNPFLRAHLPEVKKAIGMENAADSDVFAEIRTRKDNF